MKLSDCAKKQGITYKAAWNRFRDGKLPVRAQQMPAGTIIVYEEKHVAGKAVAIYARVSPNDRKEDFAGQVERLKSFEFIEAALVSQGRSIIVADDTEEMSDIAPVSTESEARRGRQGAPLTLRE